MTAKKKPTPEIKSQPLYTAATVKKMIAEALKEYAEKTRKFRASEEREFLDKALIAAMPAALLLQGWVRGERPVVTVEHRMQIAAEAAEWALFQRRNMCERRARDWGAP